LASAVADGVARRWRRVYSGCCVKIWQKILLGFLLVFVLISLIGVPISMDYARILGAFQVVKDQNLVAIETVEKMEKALLEMDVFIWKYCATGDEIFLHRFHENRKRWVLMDEHLQNLAEEDVRIRALYYKAMRMTLAWANHAETAAREARSGKKVPVPTLEGVQPVYQNLLGQLRASLNESYEFSMKTVERGGESAWVMRALALAVGLFTCWAVVRSVKRPLDRLTQATERIAAGQFEPMAILSEDEVGQLTRAFNEMSFALKERTAALEEQRRLAVQANELKTEFLANTSHELRTPLNTIMGYTQLILDGLARNPQEERGYLGTIQQSSKHLLSLINDVLDVARIEAGQIQLKLEPVSVRQVFEQVEEHMRLPAREKGLQLTVLPPREDLWVRAHSGRLSQVLFNLVGNAIKFTPSGRIDVEATLSKSDGRVCFSVRDTGIGIAPEKQNRLFQKFVQVDGSTTRHFGGTGLGLALSKTLLEMMGGDIRFQSEGEGKGATVLFALERGMKPA